MHIAACDCAILGDSYQQLQLRILHGTSTENGVPSFGFELQEVSVWDKTTPVCSGVREANVLRTQLSAGRALAQLIRLRDRVRLWPLLGVVG